jgi:hypothetical protein
MYLEAKTNTSGLSLSDQQGQNHPLLRRAFIATITIIFADIFGSSRIHTMFSRFRLFFTS